MRTKTFTKNGTDDGLGAFSYRSIIWRLVMDKLNRGAMFRYIFTKRNSTLDSYVDMDYTRNILTILSNYELEHKDQEYMPLEDLVHNLEHNMTGNVDNWFDNQTWKTEREKVTQLLYYMNYFNRRDNNWFQFVDIQCNDVAYDKLNFENWEDLLKMIESKNKDNRHIGVRITNAGRAYVGYMVQTFEFISCVEGIAHPLLCYLPSEQDLLTNDINSLPCIQIIEQVLHSVDHYIEHDDPAIQYERSQYPYTNRVVNSHIGYIDNFRRCVEYIFSDSKTEIKEKKQTLIERLGEITLEYRNKI